MMSDFEIIDTPAGPAQLKRTNRKSLAISVLPDGKLELVAPATARVEEILKRVEKRRAWIQTQRRAFKQMNAVRPEPRYANGATHRYLGRQYRLKIQLGRESKVLLRGAYLHVQVTERSDERVKDALEHWFRRLALEQFTKRLSRWSEWCRQRHLPEPRLRLRKMPKRWGSALPDGSICLNPLLIHAPSACVDYVITHEICHLKYPNHSPKFIRLLSAVCPNWRALKSRLEHAEL